MNIRKVISSQGWRHSGFPGNRVAVDAFPRNASDLPDGSLIYLAEDERFFWLVCNYDGDAGHAEFDSKVTVGEDGAIPISGFFSFKFETSSLIEMEVSTKWHMVAHSDHPLDGLDLPVAPSNEIPLVEILTESPLFRLSGNLEELRLSGADSVCKYSLSRKQARVLVDDASRGSCIGFTYEQNASQCIVVRSVFETTSEIDFVLGNPGQVSSKRIFSLF